MSAVPVQLFPPDVPYVPMSQERVLFRYQFEDRVQFLHADEARVFQGSVYSNWNPHVDGSEDFDEDQWNRDITNALRAVLAKHGKRLLRADAISRLTFELGEPTL